MTRQTGVRASGVLLIILGGLGLLTVVLNSFGDDDLYPATSITWLLAAASGGCDLVLLTSGAHASLSKRPSVGLTFLAGYFVVPTLVVHTVWIGVGYSS